MKATTQLMLLAPAAICLLGFVFQQKHVMMQPKKKYRDLSQSSSLHHKESQQHEKQLQQETIQESLALEIDEKSTSYCDIVKRSKLYSEECNNTGVGTPKRLLITGVGRSGTTLLTMILKKVGYRVSHDTWEKGALDGAVSWPHAFNDEKCKYQPWAWKRAQHFWRVAHVVRNPLKTIQSRWNKGGIQVFDEVSKCNTAAMSQGYVHTIVSKDDRKLLHTLQHWVLWNSYIEALQPSYRIQVENVNVSTIQALHNIMVQDNDTNFITNATIDHDYNWRQQQQQQLQIQQLEPFSSKLNTSQVHIQRVLQKTMNASVNSGHTTKLRDPLSWNTLMKLDKNFTIMAQLMSLRYGYPLVTDNHDDDSKYINYLVQNYRQVCGFNTRKNWKWNCYLKQL